MILRERKIWINAKETQRRSCSEKEKMEQNVFYVVIVSILALKKL